MADLYKFLAGPGVWIAFAVCIGGLLLKASFLFGLSKGKDKVFYDHLNWGWGIKSVWHWLLPLGSVSLRQQPLFGLVIWVFHICLFAAPLFLAAHNMMLKEAVGWSLFSWSDQIIDTLTTLVIVCALFLIVRRLMRPEVRILTRGWDYFLILLTAAPFVSGFLAYHQIGGPYEMMLTLHILFSEVLLILIPFTKLGHMMLFFLTRFNLGSEMGGRRNVHGREGAKVW